MFAQPDSVSRIRVRSAILSGLASLVLLMAPTYAVEGKSPPRSIDARRLLADSVGAVGGLERLNTIKGMRITATRATAIDSVASSAEAPPMLFDRLTDQMDFESRTLKETSSLNFTGLSSDINTVSVYTPQGGYTDSAGDLSAIDPAFTYRAEDLFLVNPLLALLTAAGDRNAVVAKPDSVAGFPCTWVVFTSGTIPTRICLNDSNKLPVALEIQRSYPQDDYASLWGAFVTRYIFTNWTIEPNGVFFPRTWREDTGHGENSLIYVQSIVFNAKPSPTLEIPDNFKQAFSKMMSRSPVDMTAENFGTTEPLDLGDGVYALPGKLYRRNVLLIGQSDGIVIVEAPVSPESSVYIREKAGKLFPGAKLKAVISTDNIWGHVAGVAGYRDSGAPLYVLDRNVDLVKSLMAVGGANPSTIRTVTAVTTIGSGNNAVEVIPYRTVYGARMMAVYLPDKKLLWASDLFLPKVWQPEFQMEHLWEIRDLIDREHLHVDRIMGDHRPPEDWAVVSKSIPSGG